MPEEAIRKVQSKIPPTITHKILQPESNPDNRRRLLPLRLGDDKDRHGLFWKRTGKPCKVSHEEHRLNVYGIHASEKCNTSLPGEFWIHGRNLELRFHKKRLLPEWPTTKGRFPERDN